MMFGLYQGFIKQKRQALPNPSDSRSGALSDGPGVVNHYIKLFRKSKNVFVFPFGNSPKIRICFLD